jgi:hypothetical protein
MARRATPLTEAKTPTKATPTTATSPTPEPRLDHLARLVGRAGLQTFLTEHQGRDVYRHRLPEGWPQELFGWPQLNAALAQHRLHPPRLRLERAGADASEGVFRERRTRRGRTLYDLEPAALNARLREGATLILDAANELSPPLQQLCAGLSAELLGSCQANLYAAWGETQGFKVHWDAHDVFVVQVEGRKRWALYGVTRPRRRSATAGAEHPKPDMPIEEIVLEPGDMLYLPRGYWHAAVGLGEPTLHLTIGVTRKTGTDFLHWLANEAQDRLPPGPICRWKPARARCRPASPNSSPRSAPTTRRILPAATVDTWRRHCLSGRRSRSPSSVRSAGSPRTSGSCSGTVLRRCGRPVGRELWCCAIAVWTSPWRRCWSRC